MNLILLEPEEIESGARVRLSGRRLAHVREIHRAEVGDTLRVGVVDGELGTAVVRAIGDDLLELDIELGESPPDASALRLAIALPRPPTLRKILQNATAMGVKRFELFHCRRVEKSFWQSKGLAPGALREQMMLGLEQSRDTAMPEVIMHRRFRPFAEDVLAARRSREAVWIADPSAPVPCPKQVDGPTTLVFGPEGGFIPFELERFAALGFETFSLGPRILRTEAAVVAVLGRLSV